MIPAALAQAALDRRRLEHQTFRLYVALHLHLDTREPRPLKRLVLAEQLGIRKARVSIALRDLLHAGYLERGPDHGDPGRRLRTYRLTVSPKPPERVPLRAS